MKCVTQPFTIGTLLVSRNSINDQPPYQRESGVWSQAKQQLFIDSVLNHFDVPKIYLHDLGGKSARFEYAVVDGKQRLQAIWDFLDDKFPLDPDLFKLMVKRPAKGAPVGGAKFSDFNATWAELFKSRTIDTVLVQDATEEDIEELFSRLNNGEPLNAAEKRNAMKGVMPSLIRDVANHDFFGKKVSFSNTRLQHLEVAAKFLLIEDTEQGGADPIVDLKKKYLDDLVRDNHAASAVKLKGLQGRVDKGLTPLMSTFTAGDSLLSKQAYPPLYYLFLKTVAREYAHPGLYGLVRKFLEDFHAERIANLALPEDVRDPVLIEFGRLMQQGTNDRESLRTRVNTLSRYFLQKYPEVGFKDPKRAYTEEERLAIWILGGKVCAQCSKPLPSLNDMDADHHVQWAHGGGTTIANSRALCENCNAALAVAVGKSKAPSATA